MKNNLRNGTGANGKLCSQCSQDVSGQKIKLCNCKFHYCTLCLICAASRECTRYDAALKRQKSELKINDTRPFPIQAHHHRDENTGKMFHHKRHTIPWWLAEEAYRHYAKLFGKSQSLERLAERGGFGREELLLLLRRSTNL